MKKEKPKIKQNQDVKQKATAGVRELKEYLYSKRANLTYEEINALVNNVGEKIYEMAYESGWKDRNEIYKVRKSEHLNRITRAFNHFYNDYVGELPLKTMDQIINLNGLPIIQEFTIENEKN